MKQRSSAVHNVMIRPGLRSDASQAETIRMKAGLTEVVRRDIWGLFRYVLVQLAVVLLTHTYRDFKLLQSFNRPERPAACKLHPTFSVRSLAHWILMPLLCSANVYCGREPCIHVWHEHTHRTILHNFIFVHSQYVYSFHDINCPYVCVLK